LLKQIIDSAPGALGEAYSVGLRAKDRLARMYSFQGKYAQAEALFTQVIDAASRSSGAGAPQALISKNNLAWMLATASDPKGRNPARAVELAKQVTEAAPENAQWLNTLGVAYYRAGDWKAAVATLEKAIVRRGVENGDDWFFLAMAHWQLGHKDE